MVLGSTAAKPCQPKIPIRTAFDPPLNDQPLMINQSRIGQEVGGAAAMRWESDSMDL